MTGREQVAHAGDSSSAVAAQQRGPAGNPMEPAAHPNAASATEKPKSEITRLRGDPLQTIARECGLAHQRCVGSSAVV